MLQQTLQAFGVQKILRRCDIMGLLVVGHKKLL
jgi:hypothetical protein